MNAHLPAKAESLEISIAALNQQLASEQSEHECTKATVADLTEKLHSAHERDQEREQIEPLKKLQVELDAERHAHQETKAKVADLSAELHEAKEQYLLESSQLDLSSSDASISDSFFAVGMSEVATQTVGAAQARQKELESALDRMQQELGTVDRDYIDLSIEPRFPKRPK